MECGQMRKHFERGSSIKWEQVGDVLESSGVLIETGTFIPSDGQPTTFDKDSITNLYDNLSKNLPLWISHERLGRNIPVGWVYKFALSDDETQILWKGKVFNSDAMPLITDGGFSNTSMEADLDIVNGIVMGGTIIANAFVLNPAVKSATVDTRSVAMSYGGNNMTEKPDGQTSPVVEVPGSAPVINYNFGAGIPDPVDPVVTPVVDKDGDNMTSKDFSTTIAGMQTTIDTQKLEITDLKSQLGSVKQTEFEALKTGLIGKGIEDPEKLVAGLDIDQQISTLKNFAALEINGLGAVPSEPVAPVAGTPIVDPITTPVVSPAVAPLGGAPVVEPTKDEAMKAALEAMGMTSEYDKLFGGSN